MAKITRVAARIFGGGAGTDQIAQFGSLFAGAAAFTTSAATAQSLSNWLTGWFGAAIGGNSPAIEDMNAVHFVLAYQIAYVMQAGIPEWDTDTIYFTGSFVNVAGAIYVSITDTNQGNLVSDPVYWTKIGGAVMTTLGDFLYGGTNGALTRLGGNTTTNIQTIVQKGTGIASAAPTLMNLFNVFQTKSASYAAAIGEWVEMSAAGTVTLPNATLYAGQDVGVRNISTAAANVPIATTSSQLIEGRASGDIVFSQFNDYGVFRSNGVGWNIVGKVETKFVESRTDGTINGANGSYQTAGCTLTLGIGKWKLKAIAGINGASASTGLSIQYPTGFYGADGANSVSVPTGFAGINLGPTSFVSVFNAAVNLFAAIAGTVFAATPTLETTVVIASGSQQVFFVPVVTYSVASTGRWYAYMSAERIS